MFTRSIVRYNWFTCFLCGPIFYIQPYTLNHIQPYSTIHLFGQKTTTQKLNHPCSRKYRPNPTTPRVLFLPLVTRKQSGLVRSFHSPPQFIHPPSKKRMNHQVDVQHSQSQSSHLCHLSRCCLGKSVVTYLCWIL